MKQALRTAITVQDHVEMEKAMAAVTADEAPAVLAHILFFAKDYKDKTLTLKFYLDALHALFKQHPTMNVNVTSEYGELKKEFENMSHSPTLKLTYCKKSYTPLQLAVAHDIEPVIECLIKHPMIDVTEGSPITLAKKDSELKARLLRLHLQQFCMQAKSSPARKLDALLEQHKAANLKADEVCRFLLIPIRHALEAEKEPVHKIARLQTELNAIPKGSAFESFVGESLRTKLQELLSGVLSANPTLATATLTPARVSMKTEFTAIQEETLTSRLMAFFN